MLSPRKFRVLLSKSSSSRLVRMLFPLVTDFISPATLVRTDTICPTLISVVAIPKSPKQTQRVRADACCLPFGFFLFSFSFFFGGYWIHFFSVQYWFFLTCFLLSSSCVLLLGIFRLLWQQRSWGFLLALLRFISMFSRLA